ncbi:acetyltransferase (GNAT) family protein [Kribbella sp. VKM Ac-2568]|nr:acetyltransferase (GNAT) family protein [Kribbella sp. VKM Ac-2568]
MAGAGGVMCEGWAMATIEVRKRVEGDLDECVRLLRGVQETAGYPVNWPEDPAHWLTPPDALGCWVIAVDERLAGHVALTANGASDALVERLFVDPKQTGAGLGRRLLDHCAAVAGEHGRRLGLEVADNCGAAIALYRRAGWQEAGRTPVDWGRDQASELIRFDAPTESATAATGS